MKRRGEGWGGRRLGETDEIEHRKRGICERGLWHFVFKVHSFSFFIFMFVYYIHRIDRFYNTYFKTCAENREW